MAAGVPTSISGRCTDLERPVQQYDGQAAAGHLRQQPLA